MANDRKPAAKKTVAKKTTAKKTARTQASGDAGFSAEEKAAMQARAKELKAEAKSAKDRDAGERELQAVIAQMPASDRALAKSIHALVTDAAPVLAPRTWYGMPAWSRDGKVLCFFQAAGKFKTRYATLGFSEQAKLDDGEMWPTAFAIIEFTPAVEKRLRALLAQALG